MLLKNWKPVGLVLAILLGLYVQPRLPSESHAASVPPTRAIAGQHG